MELFDKTAIRVGRISKVVYTEKPRMFTEQQAIKRENILQVVGYEHIQINLILNILNAVITKDPTILNIPGVKEDLDKLNSIQTIIDTLDSSTTEVLDSIAAEPTAVDETQTAKV